MPAFDLSNVTGFRVGGSAAEFLPTALMHLGVEIPVAPAEPPLETAAIAQPPTVIAANAATFQSATGWTVPTGVTIDTTGNGRAVVDGTGASRNIDRTIPALDPAKTYGVTVGFANKVAGRNQVSFQGGTTITLMGNGYLTGHRTARFSPASAHTLMRIGLFTETSNPQMDVIDAQIADITALLLNPRAIFIDAGQSNGAGAFARTGFSPELDKPELRCLAVPSRTATTLNCVTDGTGASYGTALTSSNGIGTPQPMTTPLAHVTAVATDVTVTPAVMPALSASRHLCDNWPYPGYTPTMILSGAAQASLFNAAHWDFEASPAGGYYRLMRAQIDAQLAAVPGSFVAGFFWQQGEADSGNLEYNAKFGRMIAELRAAYGDFPVVIREIGGLLSTGNTAAFIDRQKRLASNSGHADALSRCAYVGRPVGIADNLLLEDEAGSWIHYRADTSRTMGTAGGQAMVDLLVRRPVPGAVPAPVNTVAPVTSQSGDTLTTTGGTFTGGSGALTFATRWQRSTDAGASWAVIAGQTALTYDASGEADGNRIRSQRQATDALGQVSGWTSSNAITIDAGTAPIAGTLTNPATSMTPVAFGSGTQNHSPFPNWMKVAGDWEGRDAHVAAGRLNASGLPLAVNSATTMEQYIFRDARAGSPAGRWRLTWTGTGDVEVDFAQNIDSNIAAREIQFDFTANNSSSVVLRVRNVTAGPMRFTLVPLAKAALVDAGQRFDPDWLAIVRNQRIIRFKDWQKIDRFAEANGSGVWANRTQDDAHTYERGGVPVEEMIRLCVAIGADPWFCMPHNATADYMLQFATLVFNTLPVNRQVRVELSNKIWDFNLDQAGYLRDEAVALGAGFGASDWPEWYGGRAAEMGQIWAGVFSGANRSRLKVVFQAWTDNEGLDQDMLLAPKWRALTSAQRPGWPTGRNAPHTYFDEYAVHGILDGDLRYEDGGSPNPVVTGWIESARSGTRTRQQVFQLMAEQCTDLRHFGGPSTNGRTVTGENARWIYHGGRAAERGLTIIMYEGGTHIITPPSRGGDAFWVGMFNEFHDSQAWADIFDTVMNNWFTQFPTGIFNKMFDVLPRSANQNEGLYRSIGDSYPGITLFNAQMQARTGPTGRGAGDFVGTAEV